MTLSLIEKIVKRTLNNTDSSWGMNINEWDWVPGVGMYGIMRALEVTKSPEIEAFVGGWINAHIHKAREVKVVNSFIPMLTVLRYDIYRGSSGHLPLCREVADWIIKEAPITCDGALEHTVTEDVEFGEQMWADTLFMACLFLANMGKYTGDKRYGDFAAEQFLIHYKFLMNRETKLCYHGWDGAKRDHMSGAYWARANAWIIASTVELLELFDAFSGRKQLLSLLEDLSGSVCKYQRENGMFSTVLDKDYYDEASATAGIAYGIRRGVRLGFLPEELLPHAQRAEKAVIGAINQRGELGQVSGGTAVQPAIEDYNNIPIYPALYGQALALLMLCQRQEDELK